MTVSARPDEWVERTRSVNGRVVESWLERVIDSNTDHVERLTIYLAGQGAFEDPRLTASGTRTSTAAAPRKTTRAPRPPELEVRDKPSRFSVVLSGRAKSALNNMDISSCHEVGGGLFGYWNGLTIHIEDAIANPEPPHGYEADRVLIDIDYLRREESDYYSRLGLGWIGDWHTHPSYGSGLADPSDSDFNGWAGMRRKEPGLYVGLIMHPSLPRSDNPFALDPWSFPRRSAWVVRPSEGRTVIEPVDVRTEAA